MVNTVTTVESPAAIPAYGKLLAEKIRKNIPADSELTDFERFITYRGWEFKTKEALSAGYCREWKSRRNILITESEFIAEAGEDYEPETLKAVYGVLAGMLKQEKLTAKEVYLYASCKWCLREPEAIVAYAVCQNGRDKWIVNNRATAISEDEAKVAISGKWGFEVGRIEIIGKAYYVKYEGVDGLEDEEEAYIRFDCAHMRWLWKNEDLYQVYKEEQKQL